MSVSHGPQTGAPERPLLWIAPPSSVHPDLLGRVDGVYALDTTQIFWVGGARRVSEMSEDLGDHRLDEGGTWGGQAALERTREVFGGLDPAGGDTEALSDRDEVERWFAQVEHGS